MRSVLLASVILAATVLATAAKAQNYPWCAIYKGGAMNCGFTSFQQCLATVGEAGFCIQNSTYQPPEGPRPRYRRGYPYQNAPRYGSCANSGRFARLASSFFMIADHVSVPW
jgi:hypothetical protein